MAVPFTIRIDPCEVKTILPPKTLLDDVTYVIAMKPVIFNFSEFIQIPNCSHKIKYSLYDADELIILEEKRGFSV